MIERGQRSIAHHRIEWFHLFCVLVWVVWRRSRVFVLCVFRPDVTVEGPQQFPSIDLGSHDGEQKCISCPLKMSLDNNDYIIIIIIHNIISTTSAMHSHPLSDPLPQLLVRNEGIDGTRLARQRVRLGLG